MPQNKELESTKQPRIETGVVVSKKTDKTAIVQKSYLKKHHKYKKFIKKSTKYYVHDENNELKEGNVVQIRFVKPISKTKCWTLDKVVTS